MATEAELDNARKNPPREHYPGCWRYHTNCALDYIGRLSRYLDSIATVGDEIGDEYMMWEGQRKQIRALLADKAREE